MVMFLVGAMLMSLVTDANAIFSTARKITVTYHQYPKSWNEAQQVCETLGGSLFTEDSLEKSTVLEKYWTDWNDPVATEVWIGLHSLNINGNYTWVYGKPTCSETDPAQYSNWQDGEILGDPTKRCGFHSLTSGQWVVSKCQWSDYRFVCEKHDTASCTFNETTGIPKLSLSGQYQTQILAKPDDVACRDECLNSVYNDLNCWVATYDLLSCVLYYMSDPFLFKDNNNIDINSHQLFVKDCYMREIDTIDDTTTTSSKNSNPDMGCSELATTTSTSTTISTSTGSASSTTSTANSLTTQSNAPTISTSSSVSASINVSSSSSAVVSSSSSTTSVATTSATTSKCTCLCSDLYRNFSTDPEFANLTSEEIVEKLIEKLRVNKSTLSATIRKKTSATDDRPTSLSVGLVAIAFMATVFGLLMAGDAIQLAMYIVHKIASIVSGT